MLLKTAATTAIAGLAVVTLAAAPAFAAASFTPAGGGFVGKGDVQTAFGWKNSDLQSKASGVSFVYDSTDSYEAVCSFVTGEGTNGEKTHNIKHTKRTGVDSVVAYDARTRNQITGFTLKPLTVDAAVDDAPVVGDPCPGNAGHDGTWSSVTLLSGGDAGLSVVYGGVEVPLQLS